VQSKMSSRETIKDELSRDNFEVAKQFQLVIQERRGKFRKNARKDVGEKGNNEKRKTKLGSSVLVMLGNPVVSWKLQGSQYVAAPVCGRVFVTLYRLKPGQSTAKAVENARLVSKELKEYSLQFRGSQCHRLM
jgi:hypothetical protein